MTTIAAPKKLLTYDDYAALDDGRRYELIHGELVEMTPAPRTSHQDVVLKLCSRIYGFLESSGTGRVFVAPLDVVLDDHTTVQPDVLFIAKERAEIITEECVRGAPDLVVEVLSPSTAQRDRGEKLDLYREHGVREAWLVSPESATVQVFRFENGREVSVNALTVRETLKSEILPSLEIPLADLFAAV